MPYQLKKLILYSALVHFSIVLIMFLNPKLFHLHFPHKEKITWVRLSKGMGNSPYSYKKSKGMPESTIREQKQALKEISKDKKGQNKKSVQAAKKTSQPQETNKKTSPTGGVNFKKTAQDQTIEEALAKVSEQLQRRQVDIEAAQIEKEGEGQSPYGTLNEENIETNPVLVAYYEAIKKKINEEWITTPKATSDGQSLKAAISVIIDGGGNVISTEIDLPSGDTSFDMSAMRAIQKASPLPIPPEEIRGEAISEGFLIEFNPRSVVGTM